MTSPSSEDHLGLNVGESVLPTLDGWRRSQPRVAARACLEMRRRVKGQADAVTLLQMLGLRR